MLEPTQQQYLDTAYTQIQMLRQGTIFGCPPSEVELRRVIQLLMLGSHAR